MVRAIVIPHETCLSVQEIEFRRREDYMFAIGSHIQFAQSHGSPVILVGGNEDITTQLPVNTRASTLWWYLDPARFRDLSLRGDIVVLGQGPGATGDIPERLVQAVLHTGGFKVRVQLTEDNREWTTVPKDFDDFFSAALHAVRLLLIQNRPEAVRVVAV